MIPPAPIFRFKMSKHSENLDRIRLVASALLGNPHDDGVLSEAMQIINEGCGSALFDALRDQVGLHAENHERVRRIMSLLEVIMDVKPGLSGYLMGRLYPFADRKYAHEVYSSIGLWMCHSDEAAVADALGVLSSEHVRPALRRRYQEWADAIRKRAIQKGIPKEK
ncbi:hypothetical protein JQX13_06010 [Archangium violaceum]|uniref:hypothetical protein n=1 Tax=Archangium violaceum TaxID=83451 RepID=UPI00193BF51A|nr:hypothetical protein [Archangium violaceum]QRK09683.1 hypothetical protein JQX13_06010 [Archangium violaceum]